MKKNLLLIIFLLAIWKADCQTTLTKTMQHDGLSREYLLHIPPTYSGNKVPLIINLHGYTSNNQQQMLYTNFNAVSDTAGFIICYPNGTIETTSQQRFWNIGIAGATVNDEDFLIKLIDTIAAQYQIDQSSVYFCGMSNGGFMSYAMACAYPNRIAAIASVTGSMTTQQDAGCSSTFTMPVMQIHGVLDPTVPYYGNATMKPIEPLVKRWVLQNGCDTTPIITNVLNTNTTDGCTAIRYDYKNGNNNSAVAFYKIDSGQHTWPNGIITIGTTNRDFDASVEIWRFFAKYKSNYTAIENIENATDNLLQSNIVSDKLQLNAAKTIENFELFDINGSRLLSLQQVAPKQQVSISFLANGIYFIKVNNQSQLIKFLKQ